MKMERLRNSLILMVLLAFHSYSQDLYECNIILIVDNKLITSNISFNFTDGEKTLFTHPYHLGKELSVDKQLFKENVYLNFNYLGNHKGNSKLYEYNIKFLPGWINNTNYLIIKIYNLDKKMFKKTFCNETEEYAIEIQNQVYTQNNILCKELNRERMPKD